MVIYKSNQSIKRRLEQTQLSFRRRPETRTESMLGARTQLTLNRNFGRSSSMSTQAMPNVKRELIVYKQDDKLYIDHSAAYALNMVNVRAVMTETPHLVEIGLEELYKLQNDGNVNIEYQLMDKKQEQAIEEESLEDAIENLEQGEYGIGVHGIDKGTEAEKQGIASSIVADGLKINDNSRTVLSTSISLGTNENTEQLIEGVRQYQMGNGAKVNAVLAVPLCIQNKNGEKIFLGFPEENKQTAGQQYEEHCILDRVCADLKKVPPEFILGYFSEGVNGTQTFVKNLQHYSNIPEEAREELFNSLSRNMDDVSRSYNELIVSGNVEQLDQIKGKMQQLGLNTYMADNAIELVQRYRTQTKTHPDKVEESVEKKATGKVDGKVSDKAPDEVPDRIVGSKRTRRVLLDREQSDRQPIDSSKKRTRKVLLEAISEAKLSDLSSARETLREGLPEKEKSNEGIEKVWM